MSHHFNDMKQWEMVCVAKFYDSDGENMELSVIWNSIKLCDP